MPVCGLSTLGNPISWGRQFLTQRVLRFRRLQSYSDHERSSKEPTSQLVSVERRMQADDSLVLECTDSWSLCPEMRESADGFILSLID